MCFKDRVEVNGISAPLLYKCSYICEHIRMHTRGEGEIPNFKIYLKVYFIKFCLIIISIPIDYWSAP